MPPTDDRSTVASQARFRHRTRLASRPANRQTRVRFGSRRALLDALQRAREQSWVSGLQVDADALELVLHWGAPRRPDLCLIQGGASRPGGGGQ